MTQPRQSTSPLTARLYDLEYPRSLGVYSTYQEVQAVVDTLADSHFPVQSTLIVGTDLKLMERVTGRKTWGRIVGQGVLSGLWMGLFLGLLLMLISPSNLMVVLTSVLMGIVFFTVWSVIGYAMSGGKRDFTSMTSTIPMQYELLVEHKHADEARRLLAATGASPVTVPQPPSTSLPGHQMHGGHDGTSAPAPGPNPRFDSGPSQQPPMQSAPPASTPQHAAPRPPRPSYGQSMPTSAPSAPDTASPRTGRPAFGKPAGAPLYESPGPERIDGVQQPAAPQSPSADAPRDDAAQHPDEERSDRDGR